MSNDRIIHAWRDESYRSSLSEPERAQLTPHPAGLVELTDVQLDGISGGFLLWHQSIVLCTTADEYFGQVSVLVIAPTHSLSRIGPSSGSMRTRRRFASEPLR
jgi:mersacidin/lichenicidin family type 2 lantibiotic